MFLPNHQVQKKKKIKKINNLDHICNFSLSLSLDSQDIAGSQKIDLVAQACGEKRLHTKERKTEQMSES